MWTSSSTLPFVRVCRSLLSDEARLLLHGCPVSFLAAAVTASLVQFDQRAPAAVDDQHVPGLDDGLGNGYPEVQAVGPLDAKDDDPLVTECQLAQACDRPPTGPRVSQGQPA